MDQAEAERPFTAKPVVAPSGILLNPGIRIVYCQTMHVRPARSLKPRQAGVVGVCARAIQEALHEPGVGGVPVCKAHASGTTSREETGQRQRETAGGRSSERERERKTERVRARDRARDKERDRDIDTVHTRVCIYTYMVTPPRSTHLRFECEFTVLSLVL